MAEWVEGRPDEYYTDIRPVDKIKMILYIEKRVLKEMQNS